MKKSTMIAAAIAALALAIPTSGYAHRCFLRPLFPRVAYRAAYWQTGTRVGACAPCAPVGSTCETGACDISTPAPCEPVEYTPSPCENGACFLERTTVPAPCEPVGTCENGACFLESSKTPAPCEPTVEYYPTGKSAETVAVNEMIAILNQTRAAYGLGALANDADLEAGAYQQARECASLGWLKHGVGIEILAVNTGGLRDAIALWLQSPAHRAHLLNAGYRRAGVAVYKDGYGRAWCAVRFR